MPTPELTFCRLHSRLDFKPKSILYYARRAEFASRYFPKLYSDWQLNPADLRLIDHATEKRMSLTAGSIGFDVDGGLDNVGSITSHMAACMRVYLDEIVGDSKPTRLGLAMTFLTEHTSFEELFPVFNSNTLGKDEWCQIPGYEIRDTGFANIYYGPESNGLNLRIGVLTAEQAVRFRDELEFKRSRKFADIDGGGLLMSFDRYMTEVRSHKTIEALFSDHVRITELAHILADTVLRESQL